LKAFLNLPHGIPSHDTFRGLFERFDADEFQRGFLGWIEALHESTERQVIAIDGKTLRRSFDRAKGRSVLHMVHAWATAITCSWVRWRWTRNPTRSPPSPSC
jgi:hypothetical protein